MSGGILDLMREEAEETALQAPSTDSLTDLGGLIAKLTTAERELTDLEQQVKDKKKEVEKLSIQEIPEVFKSMGNLKSLELDDGRKVTIKDDLYVSITKANLKEAHDWLRSQGKEAIIKNTMTIQFDKGQDLEAQEARQTLLNEDIEFSEKEAVHSATLKVAVRKLLEEGVELPDCFSHYDFQKTVIK